MRLDLRIDWSEQDLFGHINNVMYAKYIQAARVNLWEKIGLTKHYSETNVGPTLAATSIQFKSPLFYPGTIYLLSGIKEIRTTSFIISHELYTEQDTLSARAEDVVVILDYNTHQKVSMSENIREAYFKLLNTRS
ncbi:MAG: acyl-CoA thioesterase [Bacteroidetes bacterium]|nr:acyl-CoA thioesterase [Bacteroidota bacterium]